MTVSERLGLKIGMLLLAAASGRADAIEVFVSDRDGQPVPNVAVYVMQEGASSRVTPGSAVMDQRDKRFVPHILVVQKGTSVEFPNSDVVAHHVYSFSKPNNFVLPLYKGDPHDPITFAYDGIVTLGCNIHDHMLGYIVIVDTDAYGVTDAEGRLSLDVDAGAAGFVVNIWSPRIRDKGLTKSVATSDAEVAFALKKKLRPPHEAATESVQWSEY